MSEIERWDEWFAACGDKEATKAWTAARQVHDSEQMLLAWARIIEMNRLAKFEAVQAGK